MRSPRSLMRRLRPGAMPYDERTGGVCDDRRRAETRHERDLTRSLSLRGPR